MKRKSYLLALALSVGASVSIGCGSDDDEANVTGGSSACSVEEAEGGAVISCEDGTTVTIAAPRDGMTPELPIAPGAGGARPGPAPGAGGATGDGSCSVAAASDGGVEITCPDGTGELILERECEIEIADGAVALSCGGEPVFIPTCEVDAFRCDEQDVMVCGASGWELSETCSAELACDSTGGSCVADGAVRIEGGGREGLVEVFHDGRWGTICDDRFDQNDAGAGVVCRMLGYDSGVHMDAYGGPIHLDEVQCEGSESSIVDCPHDEFGAHDCSEDEAVGVSCFNDLGMGGMGGMP